MKIRVGYIRVSGKGQIEGDGPERQKEAILGFCRKYKFEIQDSDIYFEPAVSGTIEAMERPMFSKMLQDIVELQQEGAGDQVEIVVESASRLARDLIVSELLLRECSKIGVKVYAADRGELVDLASNTADPTQVLIRQVLGALAQWQKTELVNKLAAARKRKREATGRCEGPKQFGSEPEDLAALNIIKLCVDENMSLREIVGQLNAAEIKNTVGNPWTIGSVGRFAKRIRQIKEQNKQNEHLS